MDLFEYKPSHPILTLRARAALRRAGATACQRRSYDLSLKKKRHVSPLAYVTVRRKIEHAPGANVAVAWRLLHTCRNRASVEAGFVALSRGSP